MSGSISTSGTSGIPTRRVLWAQNAKAMPVAPVGACPARGSAPGGFERTRDTRGPGVTAPHRQGAQRAARPGTNQSLWGQGGSVPFLRLHPVGTSSPGFQRRRAHVAELGMGVEVGMGRLACSCAPRMSAGAGSAGGKAAERRGDRCSPRGDAEPSLTSGAVGSEEGGCQGLLWDRRRRGRAGRNGRRLRSLGEQPCIPELWAKPLVGVRKGRPIQTAVQRPALEEAERQ